MSITGAELLAIVAVRGADEAAVKLAAVGGAADSAGAKLGMLAAGAIVLTGAALVGVGVASVKMAADFQQGLNRLVTGAGDVTDNMTKLGQGILNVSTDTGVLANGADGLNAAMYLIISSGQRGAQALDTLSAAAKGAQIEQASVVDVANVLSGVMTNYGTKTFNATQFMNGLITAVQHGKITLQDLAVAMGPIDPIAQQLGIHFQDVAAAMTTQTNAMIPAARAATGLRFMMMALENPTKKARDEMAALGLDSVKVADEMKISLPGALQMIVDAAKKVGPEGSVPFNRAVGDMVGGLRGLSAFIALTGPHMKDFSANAAMILAAMQQNKNAVIGWDTVQQNFNLQMDKAKAAVAALAINLGTYLLPIVTKFLEQITPLAGKINDLVTQFEQLITPVQNTAMAMQPIIDMSKPLFDTFDHASGVIKATTQAWTPLLDTFDRAKSTIKDTTQVTKPFLDTFDRASGVIAATTQAGTQVNPVLQNIYQGMKNVAQAAGDTVKFIQEMASNIQVSAPVLAGLGAILIAVIVPAMTAFAASTIVATWPFVALGVAVGGLTYLFMQFHPEITTVAGTFQAMWPIIQNTGIALAVFFTPAIIKAGIEAVVSAAKITYSFVTSLIATGFEGWAAAFKLAAYIAALAATGTQAVISAAKITVSFIASLIATASAAYASAFAVTGSLVPALGLVGIQAVQAAGKLLVSLVPALTATGVASWAAIGPIGLLAAAVIGLGVALKWGLDNAEKMNKGVTFNVDDMSTKNIATVDRMRLHLNASTDQMVRGVTQDTAKMAADAAANARQMDTNVTVAAQTMAANTLAAFGNIKNQGGQSFNDLLNQVDMDMSTLDANAKQYWADVMGYIENNPIQGHVTYTTAGGGIGVQQSATTGHNAGGTDNWRGGWSWVGERGPELMNIPRGAQIIPHDRSVAAASGGGQPVQVNINLAGHRVAQTLLPDIVQAVRSHTGVRF